MRLEISPEQMMSEAVPELIEWLEWHQQQALQVMEARRGEPHNFAGGKVQAYEQVITSLQEWLDE